MRNVCFGLCLVALIALCSGCGTTAKFVYPANDATLVRFSDGPIFNKKVAVTPFEDRRGSRNTSGTYFLYMIPLSPGGFCTYQRPDAARMFNSIVQFEFSPSEDLAKAAALSLRNSQLFSDAFFTFGGDKERADFVLEGELTDATYHGTLITYGLSVYGPLLWFFGLPCGTSSNDLTIGMSLKEVSSGKVVWSRRFTETDRVVQGLYYNMGHDVIAYSTMTQNMLNQAVKDIRTALTTEQAKVTATPTAIN